MSQALQASNHDLGFTYFIQELTEAPTFQINIHCFRNISVVSYSMLPVESGCVYGFGEAIMLTVTEGQFLSHTCTHTITHVCILVVLLLVCVLSLIGY